MSTITRYCTKDGAMFEVTAHTQGRYPALHPGHDHKSGEPTRFCTRCGQPIGVLPHPATVYCAACREDTERTQGKAYDTGTPRVRKPAAPQLTKPLPVAMDKQTLAFVRSTLGEEAAQKLERASKVYRFTSVPLTQEHLNAADRYLRFIDGGHQYEDEHAAQADRKMFAVITDQVLATSNMARRLFVGFLSQYRVNKPNNGPALKWDGVYIICPDLCGKKFIPSAIDQHMRVVHDKHTNYAAQVKEGV